MYDVMLFALESNTGPLQEVDYIFVYGCTSQVTQIVIKCPPYYSDTLASKVTSVPKLTPTPACLTNCIVYICTATMRFSPMIHSLINVNRLLPSIFRCCSSRNGSELFYLYTRFIRFIWTCSSVPYPTDGLEPFSLLVLRVQIICSQNRVTSSLKIFFKRSHPSCIDTPRVGCTRHFLRPRHSRYPSRIPLGCL